MRGTVFKLNGDITTHYWIIISEEVDGKYLAVNITDINNYPDSTCLLNAGDHPVIIKPSCIFYKKAKRFPSAGMAETLAKHAITFEACSEELLKKIIEGAFISEDLTPSLLCYLRPI